MKRMRRGEPSVAGGDTYPRNSPRGPLEGQPFWNKGSHWGQTSDLSIFMQVSPSKETFKSFSSPWGWSSCEPRISIRPFKNRDW